MVEDALWLEYKKHGGSELKEKLVEKYASLVKYLVDRVGNLIPPEVFNNRRDDLMAAGLIGLMGAIEKFRPQMNIRFESYGGRRIYGAIMDELRSMDWAPRSLRQKARRIERAYRELERELGRSAGEMEVAEKLGISREELSRWLYEVRSASFLSLEGVLSRGSESDETRLGDVVPDHNAGDPAARLEKEELVERMARCIDELEEAERTMVSLYYYEKLTMKEVGEVLGVSESRVSQMMSATMLKLRAKLATDEGAAGPLSGAAAKRTSNSEEGYGRKN